MSDHLPRGTPNTHLDIETRHYSDGSSATGPAPLPNLSSEEWDAAVEIGARGEAALVPMALNEFMMPGHRADFAAGLATLSRAGWKVLPPTPPDTAGDVRAVQSHPMTTPPDLSRVVTQLLEALEGIIDEWFDERTMAVDPFFAKARAAIAAAKKEIGG